MNQAQFESRFLDVRNSVENIEKYKFESDDIWEGIGTHPLDNLITEVAGLYAEADEKQQKQIYDYAGNSVVLLNALWYYIRRIGKLINDKEDIEWVRLGITAALIDGARTDFRDVMTSLELLWYGAERVGINPAPIFKSAIGHATGSIKQALKNVLHDDRNSIRTAVQLFGPAAWKEESIKKHGEDPIHKMMRQKIENKSGEKKTQTIVPWIQLLVFVLLVIWAIIYLVGIIFGNN